MIDYKRDGIIRLYQNHGNSIGYWEGWVESDGMVVVKYAKKLDGKPVEKCYQAKPKNVGRSNETTAYEQGILELESKARLKIDKGYVETLEEAQKPSTNSLGLLKPMLATPIDKIKPEKIDWENTYAQPKLDGHRALHEGMLYSRQGKELYMPHITQAIQDYDLDHLHLDGELYIHGVVLQDIGSLIKKNRPESVSVEYHVYDIIEDSPFIDRIQKVSDILSQIHHHIPIKVVPTHRVRDMDQLMELHSVFRQNGYEGTMLRFGNEGYQDGKRSRTLLKMKEFQDEEFIIIGYKEGVPYISDGNTYRVPVWVCQTSEGNTFDVTAAGAMFEKNQQWVSRDNLVGKPLTVKFHYYSKDGIPQLPVALRFREDV